MEASRPIIFDVEPEYRLYYDDRGDPISYTVGYYNETDTGPEGNYIVIDKFEFLCKRNDIRVIEGKMVSLSSLTMIPKLVQRLGGVKCAKEDISIIVDEEYTEYNEWGTVYNNEQ